MVKSGIWVKRVSEERSRNTLHLTDYTSGKESGELEDYLKEIQQQEQKQDKMGHLSTLSLIDTQNVINNNDNDDNNINEKTILNNGDINNCNNNNKVSSTFKSDQNNNHNNKNNINGKTDVTVMDKSKLNVIYNNNENEKKNNNSDNLNNSGEEKLLKRTNLNEKIYDDWKGDNIFGIQFKAPIKWDKVFAITALHLAFLYCLLTYRYEYTDWRTTVWAILCGGFAGFGVTAGAHRLWTHRAYKANTILRTLLIMCFSLSGQNTLYDWVRDHRVHHKFSETDADPHNSHRGFFFAHVGWLMMYKHPEVIRRGRQMDMSDILADPVVQFHQKYFVLMKSLFCFILPIIPPLLWNDSLYNAVVTQCIFRYVFCLNATWSVNSAAHLWGTRPYDRKINPAENLIVSIAAFGEGWHNYHHVFPWDYKAAELGNYTVNLSTMFIDMFALFGWAYDRKEPSKELIRKTIEKYGDGTHPEFGHHLSEVPMPDDDNLLDENLNCYDKTTIKSE